MKKVLVGGRFNAVHPGHLEFLKKARSLGDFLVVVIANDRTPGRPLFPAADRKKVLESIRFVNRVVVGFPVQNQDGYMKIILKEKPDIIALGYDQKINIKRLITLMKDSGLSVSVKRISRYKNYQTRNVLKFQ